MSKPFIRYDEELSSGITPSLPPFKAPFFISGQNVRFGPAGVEPIEPWVKAFNSLQSEPVRGMVSAEIGGVTYLFFGSATWLHKWNGSDGSATAAIASPFAGGLENEALGVPPTIWTFAVFGDKVWASDGERAIQESVSAADFEDLVATDEPTTAKIIRAIGGRPVAFNTNDGGTVIEWPELGDHTAWTITALNSAGSLNAHDAAGPIIAAEVLGQVGFLFYSKGSIHALSPAGTRLVFGQRRLFNGVGAVSKQAVVPVGNQHFVFGNTGIYVTDGLTYNYIDDPVIRKHIWDQIDEEKLSHVFGWYHSVKDCIQYFFPVVGGQGMSAVEFNRSTNSWSLQTAELTSAISVDVFRKALAGDQYGAVIEMGAFNIGGGGGEPQGDPMVLTTDGSLRQGFGVSGFGTIGFAGRVLDG